MAEHQLSGRVASGRSIGLAVDLQQQVPFRGFQHGHDGIQALFEKEGLTPLLHGRLEIHFFRG